MMEVGKKCNPTFLVMVFYGKIICMWHASRKEEFTKVEGVI